jgi:para-nitrobenzyl esterase
MARWTIASWAAALTLGLIGAPALADPVTVKVESGTLAGTQTGPVNAFRNIPYAAPPVKDLRWAPPAPAIPWTGERDATKAGVSCIQPMKPDGTPNDGGANGPMSEDCLQLNVFAPKVAQGTGKGAPVMVWIHGGSHRYGAGWVFDGSNFARDGVVLVAINYRLGALGYFAHPALTKAAKPGQAVGDYGMMDQIAALQWVQRNIAAFGGDPKNVTVFGESAGGMSTLALLASLKAKSLYQKAVVESGGGWSKATTLAAKEAEGVAAAEKLGVANATPAQLRDIPAEALNELSGNYGPFVDGVLLTETPAQAFAAGRAADVPLIIGSNSGEDSLMGPYSPAMAAMIPPVARSVYAEEAATGEETLARAIFTDRIMGAPARWVAAKASTGKPAWLYYFSYVGSRFRPMVTRAFHAAEIQYVFEYWGRRTPLSMIKPDDQAMATLMHSCWVAFAKTGKPACASGPAWPAYGARSDRLMEFGAESGVRTNFRKSRLDLQEAAVLPGLGLAPAK